MKKSFIVLAMLVAAGVASAQDSTANAASQAGSASQAGASSGSSAAIILNQNVPDTQVVNYTSTGTTTENSNVKYSGTVENRASGGYTNTENTNVHYSGTQTIKNVPGIAMSGPASGPCTGASGGLGVAGPGFGVGLNGAKVDDGCTVRENTRILGQLFQSLDSANPAKAQAQAALMKSMAILEAMNDKIAADYIKQPVAEPKKAEAPTPAQPAKVADVPAVSTPVAQATVKPTMVAPKPNEPTDPYIRARMGLPKL